MLNVPVPALPHPCHPCNPWLIVKFPPSITCPRPACFDAKSVYFVLMEATLTELRRDTSRVVQPAIHGGEKVTLTEHGQEVAQIVPCRKVDYQQACKDLIAVGPVDFLPRK